MYEVCCKPHYDAKKKNEIQNHAVFLLGDYFDEHDLGGYFYKHDDQLGAVKCGYDYPDRVTNDE